MKAQDFKIFMRQAEISTDARFLWCLILTWADADGSNAYPTIKTLSEISGKKVGWVKKNLRILRIGGYLKIGKARKKGARHFHNVYLLSPRGTYVTPYRGTRVTTTKSHYQGKSLAGVESEAILRALPDPIKETPEKYGSDGLQA